MDNTQSAKIYINGELLGSCDDPVSFTNEMREKRQDINEDEHEKEEEYMKLTKKDEQNSNNEE